MQVIERVHATARGASISISQHLSLIGVAPLLPAKQVSKPREMWVNDHHPGSPGLVYDATTGTGIRVRHCQLISLDEEHMASDSVLELSAESGVIWCYRIWDARQQQSVGRSM
jgi:hypothetical protein